VPAFALHLYQNSILRAASGAIVSVLGKIYICIRGIVMTENLIKNALHAIETMDHSREAAIARLHRAGIVTKSGKMTAFYRRCIKAQTPKD
jgi:hypothetical protein